FSSRRRHTRFSRDWSSDVCSSDLHRGGKNLPVPRLLQGASRYWPCLTSNRLTQSVLWILPGLLPPVLWHRPYSLHPASTWLQPVRRWLLLKPILLPE